MNPIVSVHRLIRNVFAMISPNNGSLKNCLKYWNPTHLPPVRPFVMSYLRNASCTPYIGM